MRNLMFALAVLILSAFSCFADSTGDSTTPQPGIPVKLTPAPKLPGRTHKTPAKPIYGEFANQVLYIFLDEADNTTYTLNVSKDNLTMETVILSADELIDGYTVNVAAPFTVELTFENGTTYSGEIN